MEKELKEQLKKDGWDYTESDDRGVTIVKSSKRNTSINNIPIDSFTYFFIEEDQRGCAIIPAFGITDKDFAVLTKTICDSLKLSKPSFDYSDETTLSAEVECNNGIITFAILGVSVLTEQAYIIMFQKK